jgi:hypothetical protein
MKISASKRLDNVLMRIPQEIGGAGSVPWP